MDQLNTLATLGLTMPSPAYLVGTLLFGLIGFALYRYGKATEVGRTKWIGIALMLYPYGVSETWVLYTVGAGLCGAWYLSRR